MATKVTEFDFPELPGAIAAEVKAFLNKEEDLFYSVVQKNPLHLSLADQGKFTKNIVAKRIEVP